MFNPIALTNMGIVPCCGVAPEISCAMEGPGFNWWATAECPVCFADAKDFGHSASDAIMFTLDKWNATPASAGTEE